MRIIARKNLDAYGDKHPEAKPSIRRWVAITREGEWTSTAEVHASFSGAKALNGERVRFEVAGGNHRMIVAYAFAYQIAFIKFIGTHAEYDQVDALTVEQF